MKPFVNLMMAVTTISMLRRPVEAQVVGNPAAVRCADSARGASWDPDKTPHCQCPAGSVNSVTVGCPRDLNEYDTCVIPGWTPPVPRAAPPAAALREASPSPTSAVKPHCDDGLDNDGDTWKDHPGDPDCASITDNSEGGSNEFLGRSQCYDENDNDGDGDTDGEDDDCSSYADNLEGPEPGAAAPAPVPDLPPVHCADGKDNDGDGKADLLDPGCDNNSDNDETNPPAPEPEVEERSEPTPRKVTPPPLPAAAASLAAPPALVPSPSEGRGQGEGDDDCNCDRSYRLEAGAAVRGFYGAPKWLKSGLVLRPLVFSIEPAPDNHLVLSFGLVYAGDGLERIGAEAAAAYRLFSWRHWGFGGELASTWVDFGIKPKNGDRVFTSKIWNVGATVGPIYRFREDGGLRLFAGYGLGWSVFAKERTEHNFVFSAGYAF